LASPTVFVLNGPNLNLLGLREPDIYGSTTLADIETMTTAVAADVGLDIDFRQTNHEGVLVDWVQEAHGVAAGLIINAGAYTMTSIALLDAVKGVGLPAIEIHLSNVFRREPFRHHSYLVQATVGIISGFGADSYTLAVRAMAGHLARSPAA
jgi:3-dehydroquinate dehydratase II